MGYWGTLFRAALDSALAFTGPWRSITFAIVTFILALCCKGGARMKELKRAALIAIGATAILFGATLIIELLFITPKKMYEEKAAEVERVRLESQSIHYTVRSIASGVPDWNGAVQVTIHANADIVPFGLVFSTDKPILNGSTRIVAESPGDPSFRFNSSFGSGYMVQARNGIHPDQIWIITMVGKEPFKIIKTERMDR